MMMAVEDPLLYGLGMERESKSVFFILEKPTSRPAW